MQPLASYILFSTYRDLTLNAQCSMLNLCRPNPDVIHFHPTAADVAVNLDSAV